jgi:nitroreductase
MEFDSLIHTRESVRAYDPKRQVPEEILARIIEAGIIAPTAANRQPFRFIVVSSEERLKAVRPCYKAGWFADAPHILIVAGLPKKAWVRWDGYNAIETDCTIAMDHMILAAENEGVSTCWIAAFDDAVLRKALDLGADEKVFAITPLGYRPEGLKRNRKSRKQASEIAAFI